MTAMRYRLALDLGSTSLGWAIFRLGSDAAPCAIVRAGVRIFPDGRNPKDGSSLAVTRRAARAMRRRRDRLLKRKTRVMQALIDLGFFPSDRTERKALERLNPYELRAKGLDQALTPNEFGRAVFHLNQRRGFLSNRKTDKKDNDSGAMKTALSGMRQALDSSGADGKPRTVGELLHRRFTDSSRRPEDRTVRARYREIRLPKEGGGTRIDKSYDLYMDRAMIRAEFDALWAAQARFDPARYSATAKQALDYRLWHQRPLRPVRPGRCTLLPEQERAPLALPSQQRFRILQEVNNLRWLDEQLQEHVLTIEQRDAVVQALERGNASFDTKVPRLTGLSGTAKFNLADAKRDELKGNITSIRLAKKDLFGEMWHRLDEAVQDEIVMKLLTEESEATLVAWLMASCGIEDAQAERIANASGLPEGYGSLSREALSRVLSELRRAVVSFAVAAKAAGFHHSRLAANEDVPGRTFAIEKTVDSTGEIQQLHVFKELPYYGEFLQRHVGFADPDAKEGDLPEKRFGRIANPTVHIGLNQIRKVVNALIKRYGHPSEVIVEVARDLKQNREQRMDAHKRQADNQKRNERLRQQASNLRACAPEQVKHADIERLILWEELSFDVANRRCPYSGVQISAQMVLSPEVEVEHILPFSQTLDDSLNNKTLCVRQANRIKGNRSPWAARAEFGGQGWTYDDILARAQQMPRAKRYRFAEDGYQVWQQGGGAGEGKSFLARALNDTRHMSRVAREYLSLICPQDTRVIPGQMTAMLRAKFGLNHVLGVSGEKNRDDHRHHAVDACVIGVTDQGLLQRFARASADARGKHIDRLVETMPLPWATYPEQVARAVNHIWVSHKPDHGHEGSLFKETAFGIRRDGSVVQRRKADGEMGRVVEYVVPISAPRQLDRHGLDSKGRPRAYKGYVPDGNHCIDIVRSESGRWQGEVTATFEAYAIARSRGASALRCPRTSLSGKPLVMRLMIDDYVRLEIDGRPRLLRVASINAAGRLSLAEHQEANVDARNRDPGGTWRYIYKQAGSLQAAKGRRVTVTPTGDVRDPGFQG